LYTKDIFSKEFRLTIFALAVPLAIILVIANIFSLLARFHWFADLHSHFVHQYIIGAFALGLLFSLYKKWKMVALMALVAVINLAELRPYVYDPTSYNTVEIKVLHYNRLYMQFRHDDLKDLLVKTAPDIVILQEANASLAKMGLGISDLYPYQIREPDNGSFGMILLSRHPFSETKKQILEGPVFKNFYLRASIQIPGIKDPLAFYALHTLPPMGQEDWQQRNFELEQTARAIAEEKSPNIILAGDWNISPFSPFFRDLLSTSGLKSRFPGLTTIPTWPAEFRVFPFQIPLDHMLHSDSVIPISKKRLPPMGSDHYPVLAEFAIHP
jgi:endonuclease/exonuclease/phosphatase (EEP) superfamily protein YafD